MADAVGSSGRRMREWRLCSQCQQEQQWIAEAVSTAAHHSYYRKVMSPRTAQ